MSEVGSGEVAIFPTFEGFRTAVVTQTDSAGKEGGGAFSKAFKGVVGGIAAGLAVGVGAAFTAAAAIGGKGLTRALNIQDAKQKLLSLGNSAGDVDTIMQNALASVKGTAFGLGDAAGVAASAVAAGIKPGEALTRTLTATANAAAIAGVPLNEMGSIINKVATNGKLTTETLQQFQDRGIPLLQKVADQYGVTADEAAKMVTEGKVNFADFQTALEKSVGDGAVGAGKTARGAFANIGAAFGRLGALFVQPAVDGAPKLFTQIAGAVDRATAAAKPFADAFAARLVPAMDQVGGLVDGIDFDKLAAKLQTVIGGIQGIYSLVVDGKLTAGFVRAFNIDGDSPVTEFLFRVRNGIIGIYDLVVKGDFSTAFHRAFNVTEDSPVVSFLLTARQAVIDFFASIGQAFQTGDFSKVTASLGDVGTALNPLFPIFLQVGQGIGAIATNIGGLLASGLPLLGPIIDTFSGALGFLRDNSELIAPIITALAVSFGVYKLAQAAANVAELGALPIRAAAVGATLAQASANRALATQMAIANGQQVASRAAMLPATAQVIIQTGAMIASRAAQIAGAAATGIATAAQWLFNAALSANPIGIIIIAIAALVAGLIFFFTQTDLGRAIWQGFIDFLVGAWNTIVAVATTVFTALGDFFTTIWNFIVSVVTAYINIVYTVITTVINAVMGAWNATWQGISDFFGGIWGFIVAVATAYVQLVMSIIVAVINGISSTWNAVWSGISSFFSGIWNAIVSFVSGAVNGVASAISGFVSNIQSGVQNAIGFITGLPDKILGILGNLGNLLFSSGQDLIQGFIDGILGMIGGIGDAIGGVMDFVGSFFPHSPAERGQFAGSGWTAVKTAGLAVGRQFGAGLQASKSGAQAAMDALMTFDATSAGSASVRSVGSSSGSGYLSGIKNIVFDGLAAFKEAVQVEIEYHDGSVERRILSGSV